MLIGICERGKSLDNQITCPHCKKIIANNPVIEDSAKRQGSDRQSITYVCGERIMDWEIA